MTHAPRACPRRSPSAIGALDPAAIDAVVAEAEPDARDRRRAARCAARPGRAARGARTGARLAAICFDALVAARRAARLDRRAQPLGRRRAALAGGGGLARAPRSSPTSRSRRRGAPPAGATARARWSRSSRGHMRALGPDDGRAARGARSAAAAGRSTPPSPASSSTAPCCAGASTARGDGERVVRAAAARPHPPAHARRPAARDRAGDARPTSCASCSAGSTCARAPSCTGSPAWRGSSRSSRASRPRPAPGSARSSPRAWPATTPAWLDELCLSGGVAWGRLRGPRRRAARPAARRRSRSSAAPDLSWLLAPADEPPAARGAVARRRATCSPSCARRRQLPRRDHRAARGGCAPRSRTALGELVSAGRVTGDGFSGLRALTRRPRRAAARARAGTRAGAGATGRRGRRGALVAAAPQAPAVDAGGRAPTPPASRRGDPPRGAGPPVHQALRRGVPRPAGARDARRPPWRDLVRIYRRMEMSGELRGGRLVGGFVGEQFAAPEAVEALRATRREEKRGELVRLSACDPLNLVGIITPGAARAGDAGRTASSIGTACRSWRTPASPTGARSPPRSRPRLPRLSGRRYFTFIGA